MVKMAYNATQNEMIADVMSRRIDNHSVDNDSSIRVLVLALYCWSLRVTRRSSCLYARMVLAPVRASLNSAKMGLFETLSNRLSSVLDLR